MSVRASSLPSRSSWTLKSSGFPSWRGKHLTVQVEVVVAPRASKLTARSNASVL